MFRTVQVLEEGRPVTVPLDGGVKTLPSVVAFQPDDGIIVGAEAKRYVRLYLQHLSHEVLPNSAFEPIANPGRSGPTPMVAYGTVVARRLTNDPLNTFYSVKRFIGRSFDSAKKDGQKVET